MGFWQNIFGQSGINEQPPTKQGVFAWGQVLGKSKILDENYLSWYKTNPFVFTAINERAKAVANAKFYIKTPEGDFIENDLTRKLNNPNPYLSRNEFLMQLMVYKGIWGTGYLYINRLRPSDTVDRFDLLNLPTDQVKFNDDFANRSRIDYLYSLLTKSEEDKFTVYYVSLDNLNKKQLDKDNLLPFFDTPIFTNPYYSESKLKSQKYIVSNIQAALESQNTFLSTPGGMGMLIANSKDDVGYVPLTDEQKNDIEKQIQQDYGSLTGQNNMRLVNAPVDYIETMVDVSKLKITESLTQNALILFGTYGLPKELLTAMMSGSTFENQKTAYKNYIQGTAQIEADSIANSINTSIPSVEGELVAKFDHLPIMQENEKERAAVLQSKVTSYNKLLTDAVIDINEYRTLVQTDLNLVSNPNFGTGKQDVQELLFNSSLNLRGTVGGVQGIISINTSVANGEMSRENAISLLVEIYQFTPEQANSMVTEPKAKQQQTF